MGFLNIDDISISSLVAGADERKKWLLSSDDWSLLTHRVTDHASSDNCVRRI